MSELTDEAARKLASTWLEARRTEPSEMLIEFMLRERIPQAIHQAVLGAFGVDVAALKDAE